MNSNTRIIDLTLGELMDYINMNSQPQSKPVENKAEEWLKGLEGLASLLGCSMTKACQLNRSGLLKEATRRHGRKIIFNKSKVLEILNK